MKKEEKQILQEAAENIAFVLGLLAPLLYRGENEPCKAASGAKVLIFPKEERGNDEQ